MSPEPSSSFKRLTTREGDIERNRQGNPNVVLTEQGKHAHVFSIPLKRLPPEPAITYAELHAVFHKWLYLEPQDHEALDVIWAAALDRDVPGDPLWLYVVGPSGAGKSEYLMSVSEHFPKAYALSALTPQTLISGKWLLVPGSKTTENPKGKYELAGILKDLDGLVLIIKDLTVILSMKEADRYEIMSQFRDSYDHHYAKAFGSLREPVRVDSTYGFVAGVTPLIDFHQKAATMLGERFLKIRLHPDDAQTTQRAYRNTGMEDKMRKELSGSVVAFLTHLDFSHIPDCTEEQSQQIITMARYIARMRTWVFAKIGRTGEIYDVQPAEPESPTRAVKQLTKLVISLALVRGHPTVTDEDITTLRRVCKDTGIPQRQTIVETMMTHDKEVAWFFVNLSERSGLYYNSVRIECEKMRQLGILRQLGPASELTFAFTPEFIPVLEATYGRPVPLRAKEPIIRDEGNLDSVLAKLAKKKNDDDPTRQEGEA